MSGPDSGREALLIHAFVGLADTLVDDYDVIDVLDRLAGYSVQLLAAESVGILLADAQATLRVVASTNEQTEWMELLQLQADEGPCVECFRAGAPVNVDDLAEAAVRWPRFVAALQERGAYGSVHALPLRLRGQAIGTLNLFHACTGAAARRRPGAGPGAGRCRDDRDLAGTRDPPRRGADRAVAGRVEQSGDHRAGQGCPRPAREPDHARRVRPAAPLRPRPQLAAHRGGPPDRRDRSRR